MNIDDSETSEKRYTLRPTFTPLPSKCKKDGGRQELNMEPASKAADSPGPNPVTGLAQSVKAIEPPRKEPSNPIRAANEDDDLYDPYSDYHDGTLKAAEFEEEPWR